MSLKETLGLIESIANKYLIDKPYLVGGVPRDLYLKLENVQTADLDLTTNSSDVLRLGILVADELNVTFELSDDGHITVFADEYDIDFSSHFVSPKVVEYLDYKFIGLEEAFSRDFTINTLHQDLLTSKITDPTGKGFSDIENKIIRTPVPCEITLSDDPRRAYRAINLAARYGFEIDNEIKNFTKENPHLFLTEKIKDKYIAVKISKALKQNPDLTIKLLKEMGLFANVPLSGVFKEILIQKKMLLEYLNSQAKNNMIKSSSLTAKTWEEYSAQGPDYKLIEDWWLANYSKMPGNKNLTYQSWIDWYLEKYNSDWQHQHKGPAETLSIMQSEIADTKLSDNEFTERKNKLLSLLNPLKKNKDNVRHKVKDERTKYKVKDMRPDKNRVPERAKDYKPIENGKVYIKPGVDVENVSQTVKSFITELGNVAERINAETPIITSGWRSVESQAKIMANNWKSNGGLNGGRQYLEKLYGKSYGDSMADIFETHGTGNDAIALGVSVISKRNTGGSNHISNPGKALDLSITNGIKDVLDIIKGEGRFDIGIGDETGYAGPHYHISIHGEKLT